MPLKTFAQDVSGFLLDLSIVRTGTTLLQDLYEDIGRRPGVARRAVG
jgi:hypothetical protein